MQLRRVGVALHGIERAHERQLDLFEDRPREKGFDAPQRDFADGKRPRQALDQALDHIRKRHGFGAVTRGRAVSLMSHLPQKRDDQRRAQGFLLRTPACSQ